MTKNQIAIARQAHRAAMSFRRSAGKTYWEPVCIYDLADAAGIEVRFLDLPSMEGMYCKSANPMIIINSLRPSGRKAYTCAHELGHHVFGHGTHIDELGDGYLRRPPKEYLADVFAGFLLMPKVGVLRALNLRTWSLSVLSPIEIYTLAGYFGVGYTTFVFHLHESLGMISASTRDSLSAPKLIEVRSMLLGEDCRKNLVVVENSWAERAVDAEVGDLILGPRDSKNEGCCIEYVKTISRGNLYQGVAQGIGKLVLGDGTWSAFVRVSKKDFVGRSIFRHLEDPEG